MEFKTFLAGMDYPTGKITHAGTGMGKILYSRAYMGNPMGRFFLMGTGMESYYPTGMYLLPSLGMDEVAYAECRSPTFFIDHACMQCGWSHERSGWACSHVRMVYGCRRFETGGSLGQRVKCRRVPQPRWVGARRSAKGGKRRPERERERGGNPAAFVFVPRPGRVRLQ
jgi:hypothetical protein